MFLSFAPHPVHQKTGSPGWPFRRAAATALHRGCGPRVLSGNVAGTGKSPLSTEIKKAGNGKIMENHLFLWSCFFLTPRTWRVYSMVTPTKRWFNTLHLLFQLYSGSNDVKWDLYPLNKNEICGPQGLRQKQNYAILCDFAILWWQGEYFIIFFVFLFNGQVSSSGLDQLPSPAASTAERAPGYSLCIKFQWIFQ